MSNIATAVDIQLKSVLIATDFSKASEKPLRSALAIARYYGAKFFLAHIVSPLGIVLAGPGALTVATEAVWRDARQLENDLARRGEFSGLGHEVIIRQGDVWEELSRVIRQEHVDLVVIGTHGRRGLGKLLLGSVAEKIFRCADGPVLTVGPGCNQESSVGNSRVPKSLLFATDFGQASLHALPFAISSANHFGAKLVLIHVGPLVVPPNNVHRCTAVEVVQAREDVRVRTLQRLEELVRHSPALTVEPELVVEFGIASDKILEAADLFCADAIIMGLHHSSHIATASHMPWATAYEVVCGAACPVLTIRN